MMHDELDPEMDARLDLVADVVASIVAQAVEQGAEPMLAVGAAVLGGTRTLAMLLGPTAAAEALRDMATELDAAIGGDVLPRDADLGPTPPPRPRGSGAGLVLLSHCAVGAP